MSKITPVTHTEKVVAGQVDAVTHLEHVIAEYGGGNVYENLEAGTNILIEETSDGKAKISASGEISSEDTVARADIAAIKDGETLDSFGDVETALGDKADTSDIPTVPITAIQKNGTGITPVSGTVNITVPTTAADVSALPASTKYAAALSLTINSSTYVMTGQLKDQNGDNLGTAQTIDLPLESVVVGGSYNSQTKKVVLTLQNGNTIEFSVADLVSGLQIELSASNKLNPAYINYDSTHRAVSDTEKSTWNGKQSALDSTQLAAVNSGIDSTKVAQIETNKNNILTLQQRTGKITAMQSIGTDYTLVSEVSYHAGAAKTILMTAALQFNNEPPRGIIISKSNNSSNFNNVANLIAKAETTESTNLLSVTGIGVASADTTYYVWAKSAGESNNAVYLVYQDFTS